MLEREVDEDNSGPAGAQFDLLAVDRGGERAQQGDLEQVGASSPAELAGLRLTAF